MSVPLCEHTCVFIRFLLHSSQHKLYLPVLIGFSQVWFSADQQRHQLLPHGEWRLHSTGSSYQKDSKAYNTQTLGSIRHHFLLLSVSWGTLQHEFFFLFFCGWGETNPKKCWIFPLKITFWYKSWCQHQHDSAKLDQSRSYSTRIIFIYLWHYGGSQ